MNYGSLKNSEIKFRKQISILVLAQWRTRYLHFTRMFHLCYTDMNCIVCCSLLRVMNPIVTWTQNILICCPQTRTFIAFSKENTQLPITD